MATSLMNDVGYARNIVWHLAEMGDILFSAKDAATRAAELLLKLEDDEISDQEDDLKGQVKPQGEDFVNARQSN